MGLLCFLWLGQHAASTAAAAVIAAAAASLPPAVSDWRHPLFLQVLCARHSQTFHTIVPLPACTAFALAELAERAGLPPGVLNILSGDAKAIGDALMQSNEVGGQRASGAQQVQDGRCARVAGAAFVARPHVTSAPAVVVTASALRVRTAQFHPALHCCP